ILRSDRAKVSICWNIGSVSDFLTHFLNSSSISRLTSGNSNMCLSVALQIWCIRMFALSTCQRSLAQTIQVPVSATNRQRKPKILMRYSARPRGVQWHLCRADNSSGSSGGRGRASAIHTTLSFSSCMRLLLFQRGAVLLGHTCGCGAHGSNAVVGPQPFRAHQGGLTEHPVDAFEIKPGAVAGRHRTRQEFVEAPSVRSGLGEVEQLRVGKRRCGCG